VTSKIGILVQQLLWTLVGMLNNLLHKQHYKK